MQPIIKRLLFLLVSIAVTTLIALWNKDVYAVIGAFAIGWTIADISKEIFPDNVKPKKGEEGEVK